MVGDPLSFLTPCHRGFQKNRAPQQDPSCKLTEAENSITIDVQPWGFEPYKAILGVGFPLAVSIQLV